MNLPDTSDAVQRGILPAIVPDQCRSLHFQEIPDGGIEGSFDFDEADWNGFREELETLDSSILDNAA